MTAILSCSVLWSSLQGRHAVNGMSTLPVWLWLCLSLQVAWHLTFGGVDVSPHHHLVLAFATVISRHDQLLCVVPHQVVTAALCTCIATAAYCRFCLEEWQDIWNCCLGNKLHAIYPVVGTAQHNKIRSRRDSNMSTIVTFLILSKKLIFIINCSICYIYFIISK